MESVGRKETIWTLEQGQSVIRTGHRVKWRQGEACWDRASNIIEPGRMAGRGEGCWDRASSRNFELVRVGA
eukprot:3103963-Rhodomonas_salina.1